MITKKKFRAECESLHAKFRVEIQYDDRFVEVEAPNGYEWVASDTETMVSYYAPEFGDDIGSAYQDLIERMRYGVRVSSLLQEEEGSNNP